MMNMEKKSVYTRLFVLLSMLTLFLSSCKEKEEIVFESELPRFELREDRILLEVIVPSTTPVDDKIFIVGSFNGGESNAVNNSLWQLEKASDYDYKYGIYLDPNTFSEGTSLSDGFYFYSTSQGKECALDGTEILHVDNPSLNTRTNVTVSRWASYFEDPDSGTEQHDGYVIYVVDHSEYDELAMYAYGDAEAFGAWPGMRPTGVTTVSGTEYTYFDTGESNEGMALNLIFNNNNNGSQLADFPVTLDRDYYLELTPDGVTEIDPNAEPEVEHDGYAIFIEDLSGWNALAMYAWGSDIPELFGAWPGVTPTGEVTVNGVRYQYFDTGAANEGMTYNLIMNDNNGGSQFDLSSVVLDRDYYFTITGNGGTEIDPETYEGGGVSEETE